MAIVSFRESRPFSLSERIRKAFQLANQEAHRLGHSEVGIEHLLVGLIKEGQSKAARLLRGHGFDLAWLRSQLEAIRARGIGQPVLPGSLPYSLELIAFTEDVIAAAESTGLIPLTPEFLLAALLEAENELVSKILARRKRPLSRLRRTLARVGTNIQPDDSTP
jgi:ATP-dependent Clp protease ATP-binding subunit ClpC